MNTETSPQYAYFRSNIGDARNAAPTRITEKECRVYISCTRKNVDRAMTLLHKGHSVQTTYAVFTAKQI